MTPSADDARLRVARLSRLLDSAPDMILAVGADGRIEEANSRATRRLGPLKGKPARAIFARPGDFRRLSRRAEPRRILRNLPARLSAADGSAIDASLTLSSLKSPSGKVLGTVLVARDVTGQRDLEREVRRKSRFLSEILSHCAAMVVTTDPSGRITEFNPEATRILGYSREEAIGKPAESLYLRKEDRARLLRRILKEGQVLDFDARLVTKDRQVLEVSLNASFLRDDEEKVLGTVAIGRDVTAERRLERKLQRLSVTDSLTRLFNRRYFFKALRRERLACSRDRRGAQPLSIVLIDVDRFKAYNDRHGHLMGDRALRAVAHAILRSVRRHMDVPARFGGDEFVILLPEADAAAALVLAERIRRRFAHAGLEDCTLSIGIAQYERSERVRRLVHRADEAMYAAKRAGGDRIEIA